MPPLGSDDDTSCFPQSYLAALNDKASPPALPANVDAPGAGAGGAAGAAGVGRTGAGDRKDGDDAGEGAGGSIDELAKVMADDDDWNSAMPDKWLPFLGYSFRRFEERPS